MKVVHICSDFSRQSIYNQLIMRLSALGKDQSIYVPVRTADDIDKYRNNDLKEVRYQYSHILNKFDRINYFGKIKKTFKDLLTHFPAEGIDIVHAHFLFSDGGIAYELNKKYGIPYIVAVRNTDLNFFFKYFIHLRKHGIRILQNASKIIFLSHPYKDQLVDQYVPAVHKDRFLEKSLVIPNGIDDYWHQNSFHRSTFDTKKLNILYVGDFSKNKNINITIKALKQVKAAGQPVNFHIVGGGGNGEVDVLKLVAENSDWITITKRLNDKSLLKEYYRNADIFLMPSRYETFGLVYIEAMSQGLPVIYSMGQGIDGYFKEGEVGYGVKSGDYVDIANKILSVTKNYVPISNNCSNLAQNFSWDSISYQYQSIYKEVLTIYDK